MNASEPPVTPLTIFLILVALATLVAGQLLLKWALSDRDESQPPASPPPTRRHRAWVFAGGILGMTISFFVNLGLLQDYDLSLIFPFQGLSVIIVIICARIFLKERLTFPLVIGALCITVGVILVSAS